MTTIDLPADELVRVATGHQDHEQTRGDQAGPTSLVDLIWPQRGFGTRVSAGHKHDRQVFRYRYFSTST